MNGSCENIKIHNFGDVHHQLLNTIIKSKSYAEEEKDGRIFYFMFGKMQSVGLDPARVIQNFSTIIKNIADKKIKNVDIVFKPAEEDYFILQEYIVQQLLNLTGMSHVSLDETEFNFIIENKIGEKKFKQLLNLRRNSVNQSLKSSRLSSLREFSNTQDEKYIKQLESIMNIIDDDDVPILIVGESGVGKSRISKKIHEMSIRGLCNFEQINCGAFSTKERIEQKLYGWVRGAFTGAIGDTEGILDLAEGGTIFLDEIDKLNTEGRHFLHTFLELKEYRPIGATKLKIANVRFIFGSSRELKQMVKEGSLEKDFYYRIANRILTIPPLRERPSDISIIINAEIKKINEKNYTEIKINADAHAFLNTYSWPGNARELVQYVTNRIKDCYAENEDVITLGRLKETPFIGITETSIEDFNNLKEIMKRTLDNWDYSNGKFLNEYIIPIISKLYMDDCFKNMKKTEKLKKANTIVGIGGAKHNNSTLQEAYNKYSAIEQKLK